MPRHAAGIMILGWLLVVGPAAAAEPVAQRFTALDADGDEKLSREEFRSLPGERAVLERDFTLFDLDANSRLSPEEFDAVPLGRPPHERGALPDPFVEIANQAMAQLDEAYDQWDQNPNQKVDLQSFVQSFLLSFPDPDHVASDIRWLQRDADANGDSGVSRDEALRFLRIQLGVERGDGVSLRWPNGQVVRCATFVTLNGDENGQIDRGEFQARWPDQKRLEEDWKRLDRNGNGRISFEEFAKPDGPGVDDPIEQFRRLDADLDAFVDEKELLAGSAPADLALARHAFPGFDLDRDQKLSLWEFRQLPQANFVLSWHTEFKDADRNERLQFAEFTLDESRRPLLRYIVFSRFDTDGNGALEAGEFAFAVLASDRLVRINADGTDARLLFTSDKYKFVGSPKISPDGKWLTCDAVPKGELKNRSLMLRMTIEGKEVEVLGEGMMPTWSSDGKKIAFSRVGVQTLDLATKEIRTLTPAGWGAQWSPDGARIAFTHGAAIKTLDVETEDVQEILSQQDSPYQSIYWNFCWSGDSRRIGFLGERANGQREIASVGLHDSPDLKVHYTGKRFFSNNLAWSPDGTRLVLPIHGEKTQRMLLHEFNPLTKDKPQLLKGPDESWASYNACWSPDGKFLIVHGRAE